MARMHLYLNIWQSGCGFPYAAVIMNDFFDEKRPDLPMIIQKITETWQFTEQQKQIILACLNEEKECKIQVYYENKSIRLHGTTQANHQQVFPYKQGLLV